MLAVIAHATPMQYYILREQIFTILCFLPRATLPSSNSRPTSLHSSQQQLLVLVTTHLHGGSKSCLLHR
uniref:Uncharacterized protein n=1 Tax=Arundo donax TaxID=35708 RepID=A0A0A9F2H1_ARUDO